MKVIQLHPDGLNPGITLNKITKQFEIYGKSCPEDAVGFYKPVLDWLDEYKNEALDKTIFEFRLNYYNTASSKVLYALLRKLEIIHESGKEVIIRWLYPEEDDLHREAAEEFSDLIDVPLEIVPLKNH